jgi:hypothetical protein
MDLQLLQMLAQNPAAGREMLQSLFTERAAADPQLAMVLQMMGQQRPAESVADDDGNHPPERPAADSRKQRVARVRARLAEMREELTTLRGRNDAFAEALGACAVCWGDDERCRECRGAGRPGWREPDPERFRDLVAPAVRRLAGEDNQAPNLERER